MKTHKKIYFKLKNIKTKSIFFNEYKNRLDSNFLLIFINF
jgi:hypothetical protein